jgi:hypothetical protein
MMMISTQMTEARLWRWIPYRSAHSFVIGHLHFVIMNDSACYRVTALCKFVFIKIMERVDTVRLLPHAGHVSNMTSDRCRLLCHPLHYAAHVSSMPSFALYKVYVVLNIPCLLFYCVYLHLSLDISTPLMNINIPYSWIITGITIQMQINWQDSILCDFQYS